MVGCAGQVEMEGLDAIIFVKVLERGFQLLQNSSVPLLWDHVDEWAGFPFWCAAAAATAAGGSHHCCSTPASAAAVGSATRHRGLGCFYRRFRYPKTLSKPG